MFGRRRGEVEDEGGEAARAGEAHLPLSQPQRRHTAAPQPQRVTVIARLWRIIMNLEEVYFITQIGVGIAIIVSIVFVALELRQNSYLLRKSMADNRVQRINWLFETLVTDNEFRNFHQRIDNDYDNFTDDERYRAMC